MPKAAKSPKTASTPPLLDGLNPEQRTAVTHAEGPLLIVAGAGTGKTKVITTRIAWLILEQQVPTDGILALTFTEKAATEMEERLDRMLPFGYVDLWVQTFHGFCDRILKRHALDIGLPNDYRLLDATAAWMLLREHLDDLPLDYYRPRGNPTKFLHALLQHFSRCKDEAVTPADYLAYAKELQLNADTEHRSSTPSRSPSRSEGEKKNIFPTSTLEGGRGGVDEPLDATEAARIAEVANAYHAYEQLLHAEGALDFGDLLLRTLELFRTRPAILARYRRQFAHVLVDEFQDTNWSQYEIVKMLANPTNNLTVVGDDDQCLPAGTRIAVSGGTLPIERIRTGMEVVTAVGKGYWSISHVRATSHRTVTTQFVTITTASGQRLTATGNHKMFCVAPWLRTSERRHHYVYLMWRNNLGWRIGVTNDISQRLRLERSADYIVALRDFPTDQEARFHEALWSLRYALPTTCFKERDGVAIVGPWLRKLYGMVDTERGARALARDLGVDLDAPTYTLGAVTRGSSRRVKVLVDLCIRPVGRKRREGVRMERPTVRHQVQMETSDPDTLRKLERAKFTLSSAKRGKRFRQVSTDMRVIEATAQRLRKLTGGMIEYRCHIARRGTRTKVKAVLMPAGNIVRGLYVPVWHANGIRYEEVVDVRRCTKRERVYDFEVDRTHNYVANGIVVHNSIYRWRGAAMSNILHFQEDFPQAKQVAITTNYRSRQNILDAAYASIQQNNPARLEVTLGLSKHLRADAQGSGTIAIIHAQDAGEEARMVVERIAALRDAAGAEWSWNDVAILVRANRQADQFLPVLNAAGIPYQFLASRGLYRKPIVLDLLAYLELLDDHHESTALYRVLNIPVFAFTYDEVLTLTNWAGRKAQSLYAVIRNAAAVPGVTPGTVKKVQHVLDLIAKHAELARQKPVREVILAFFTDTGYLEDITKEENAEDHETVGFLNQFWKRVEAFEESAAAPTLTHFMEAMALEREAGEEGALPADPNAGPEAVRVLTVHAAKGLEFRHVFVVNLIEQRFPSTDRSDPIELPPALTKVILPEGDVHIQEERRLFYVACTRAKEGLYLCYADDYGGTRTRKPSRFLKEIGIVPPRHSEKPRDEESRATQKRDPSHVLRMTQRGDSVVTPLPPTHALPSKLSFTQLRAYTTCPWQYHYAHVLRIPLRGRYQLSFGSTMHLTLQKFFDAFRERSSAKQGDLFGTDFSPSQRAALPLPTEGEREGVRVQTRKGSGSGPPPPNRGGAGGGGSHATVQGAGNASLDDLLTMYQSSWIDDWYESAAQKKKYYDEGKRILKEFYAKHEAEGWPNVQAAEQPFMVKFDQYSVKGKADRIDALPDGVEIVDYKTGKPKEKLEAEDKMQLLIYQVAATQALGVVPKVLSYYYLENNSKQSFIGTDEEIAKLHDTIVAVGTKIANGDFKPTPGRWCSTCDFKNICPYAQS